MLRLLRPALSATRAQPPRLVRSLSSTTVLHSDHGHKPSLLGAGAKPGAVPTDEEQATGLERLQLLGNMKGVDVFNEKPLDSSRVGTLSDPIIVSSLAPNRIIGCTGSPADSHDTIWLPMNYKNKHHRCPECGSVYRLGYEPGPEDDHAHH